MYQISQATKSKARELGVEVRPSKLKNKKIDIYKDGLKLYSIGDIRYGDFHTFMREYGQNIANERRRLYKLRHGRTRNIKGSKSWYADQLLW